MAYLADTNVLLRLLEPGTPACQQAQAALKRLRAAEEQIFITPQNIVEFWNGATRPRTANGLGLLPDQAEREVQQLERLFPLLTESPALYVEWRRLVRSVSVSGVQVHDARLAAAMRVHDVSHLLTFNGRDFGRYPGVTVVHPQEAPSLLPDVHAQVPHSAQVSHSEAEASSTKEVMPGSAMPGND